MTRFRSLIEPAGHALADHLKRLGVSLADLGGQLRQAVAGSVGRAAAGAVRQAVAIMLRQPGEDLDRDEEPSYHRDTRSSWDNRGQFDPWKEPDESRWGRQHDRWSAEEDDLDDRRSDGDPANESGVRRAGVWRSLLAAGCRVLAWLLGCLTTTSSRLAAVGAGMATALAVWLAGPGAGPGSVLALTDALAAAAVALARLAGN